MKKSTALIRRHMKRILNHQLVVFTSICVAVILLLLGCNSSSDGYKQITVNNELGHYSFEYPSHYKRNFVDNFDFKVPYATLVLEGPVKSEEAEVFDPNTGEIKTVVGKRGTSVIYIGVSNYKVYFGESYSATDKIEGVLEDMAKWANFKLLERSPLTVSGVEGEMIVYLVDKLMPIPVEDGKNLLYVRAVYFDYQNLTWEIEAKCNQDIQEQVKADFDHIIQTFKILE